MAYISPTWATTNQYVKYRLVIDLLEQDNILAKSKLRRRLQAWRTTYWSGGTYGSGTASVRNDLGTPSNEAISPSQVINLNTYTVLFEDEIWVDHNADGSKSLQVGGYFNITGIVNSTQWNDFTVILPTIPRGSVPTATAANIEEATTININKYNSGFTSTLRFEFPAGDASPLIGTIVDKTPQISYGWELPSSFYDKIPNSSLAQCKIYCDTYSGDTLIETKACLFNASVNPITNAPDVSAVIEDSNALTVALSGSNAKIVKFASQAHTLITALAKNGASIVSYKTTCLDGKISTLQENWLNFVESNIFDVMATDSRGLTKTVRYTLTLVDYVKLTANPNFQRNTPTDNKVKLSYNGNYFNDTFGSVVNTLALKYRYREKGTPTWSPLYTLPAPTLSGDTFSAENIILAPGGVETSFPYGLGYEFELIAYDEVSTSGVTSPDSVNPGIPATAHGKDWFKSYVDSYFAKDVNVEGQLLVNGVQIPQLTETGVQSISSNSFMPSALTTITGTYPQLIPMNKIRGDLNISSDLITLPKGYIYKIVSDLYGVGAGLGRITIYENGGSVSLLDSENLVTGSTETGGRSSCRGYGEIDLTLAASDMVIKVVCTLKVGTTMVIQNTHGLVVIEKLKKTIV
ncbi:MAG: DUF859 family phage minor structural protein [Firmicutes bacterium]|nr:DUF859 family phage minor structural protein [Bacillota bacterium]